MDLSLTAVYSALSAAQSAMENTSQDLANVRTPGYRPQQPLFESTVSSLWQGADGSEERLPWGVQFSPGRPLQQDGPLQASSDPLHAALSDSGDYFTVQTPQGTAYTRDGAFRMDGSGRLVDASGNPVLGEDGPIEGGGAGGRIGPDGSFSADGIPPQKLAVANLQGRDLRREGAQLFTLAPGQSSAPAKGAVVPGTLEGSGADTFKGMAELVTLSRWAESVQKAAKAGDDSAEALIQAAKLSN